MKKNITTKYSKTDSKGSQSLQILPGTPNTLKQMEKEWFPNGNGSRSYLQKDYSAPWLFFWLMLERNPWEKKQQNHWEIMASIYGQSLNSKINIKQSGQVHTRTSGRHFQNETNLHQHKPSCSHVLYIEMIKIWVKGGHQINCCHCQYKISNFIKMKWTPII